MLLPVGPKWSPHLGIKWACRSERTLLLRSQISECWKTSEYSQCMQSQVDRKRSASFGWGVLDLETCVSCVVETDVYITTLRNELERVMLVSATLKAPGHRRLPGEPKAPGGSRDLNSRVMCQVRTASRSNLVAFPGILYFLLFPFAAFPPPPPLPFPVFSSFASSTAAAPLPPGRPAARSF